ncbi:MAG: hypothetical protein AAF462_01565 [Thermodesulfobacteriota bacterium]
MAKLFLSIIMFFVVMSTTSLYSSADIQSATNKYIEYKTTIELAQGRLFIGMTKIEAFDVEGVPYRVKRLEGEDGKEMWIYRCNNDDGFDEDCLYLYFNGDELSKIERP